MKKRFCLMVLAGLFCASVAIAEEESVCASVALEIKQDLTLERQAFDARMKLHNGLVGIDLENVDVTLTITDQEGNEVATADVSQLKTNPTALFFIQTPRLKQIDELPGGTVYGGTSAEMSWLLIPALGASNADPDGKRYYVGATLTYTMQGETNTVTVAPDSISVKPMPYLELDYFLPGEVYGNDAFSDLVEPSIPFPVGLRIYNRGLGGVGKVQIESAQPTIEANDSDLKVNFGITGSSVNGQPYSPSLLLNFGDFEPLESKMGYWEMTASLSGVFSDFKANIAHSDELGGLVTSLINPTNVHTHICTKDVVVDLPDRDRVLDFLTDDFRLYESEDGLTNSVGECVSAFLDDDNADTTTFDFNSSLPNDFVYGRYGNDIRGETKRIKSVTRSDGKRILESNAWLSKERPGGIDWSYYFNLFDVNGAGYTYTVVFEDASSGNNTPVIYYVGPKKAYVDQTISFLVMASCPDGTVPTLNLDSTIPGSSFTPMSDVNDLSVGTFSWTPNSGQTGSYQARFTAGAGGLSDSESVPIQVMEGVPLVLGYPGWWLSSGVINTNAIANDYAAVNQGQLKHIATMAWDEFNVTPGGAPTLDFGGTNDYAAVNLGQVKGVAAPFYDQLGMSNSYPWAGESNSVSDYAIANIGQVKNLFSFEPRKDSDMDGLPDWWESSYTNSATAMPPEGNPDGDEHSNLYEYLHGTNPNVND